MSDQDASSFNPKNRSQGVLSCDASSINPFLYYVKHSPNDSAIFDRNMIYLACSDRHLQNYGLSYEQVIGKCHYDFFPNIPQRFRDAHYKALHGSVVKKDQDSFNMFDGTTRYSSWECRPWYDDQGEIGGMILYGENLSEHMLTLQEANDQMERDKGQLEAVLSHMDSGVIAIDLKGNVIHANDALAKILGYQNKAELPQTKDFFEHTFELYSYPGRVSIPIKKWPISHLNHCETIKNKTYVIRRIDTGEERIIEYFGTPIYNAKGSIIFQLLILSDVSERKMAEEELRETKDAAEQEQAKWQAILDHVSTGVDVFDANANRVYSNTALAEIYGFTSKEEMYSEWTLLVNNYVLQTYPDYKSLEEDEWAVPRVLRGEMINGESYYVKSLDNNFERILKLYGTPIYNSQGEVLLAVFATHDMTEEVEREKQDKLIQERVDQAERLESLGVLAGGIAHDFNNLLAGFIGNVEMARRSLCQKDKAHKYIESASHAMERAKSLTQQLLTFAKGGNPVKEALSLPELIDETARFCLRGSNVGLQLQLAPELWMVDADKGQLSQVVSNLVINAKQAMADGGNLTISATNIMQENLKWIQLKIEDQGEGIDAECVDKIFDPYFTTKSEGSGLGLATCHSIISKHNGHISVASRLGEGTTFTIMLPASSAGQATSSSVRKVINVSQQKLKILILDDEEMIRQILASMLEEMGHLVTYAEHGYDAIQFYSEALNGVPYDIVITDLTLPGGIGGLETAKAIFDLDQNARIIVSSGYADDPIIANFSHYGFVGRVVKPYLFEELEGTILECLTSHTA